MRGRLPYADLPPWSEWLAFAASGENAWEAKRDQMVWVGSPTNPMRQAFQRCASHFFGDRLVHRMPHKEPMHQLAWRCKPTADGVPCAVKPPDWTPLQEQCKYKYILHLPGISDWLEHVRRRPWTRKSRAPPDMMLAIIQGCRERKARARARARVCQLTHVDQPRVRDSSSTSLHAAR